MAYTVLQLINNAFYLSQIVSRDIEEVTSDQASDGLSLLNGLLARKSVRPRLIPFYTEYELDAVIGQEVYFIPRLIEAETVTFNLGNVRFGLYSEGRDKYQGDYRVDDIQSLMYKYNVERTLGGSNLSFYFVPSDTFPIKIWGKFELEPAEVNDDLELIFPLYYIEYLRYLLAAQICMQWGMPFSAESQKELNRLELEMTDIGPLDLTMKSRTMFTGKALNWGVINLSRGFWP